MMSIKKNDNLFDLRQPLSIRFSHEAFRRTIIVALCQSVVKSLRSFRYVLNSFADLLADLLHGRTDRVRAQRVRVDVDVDPVVVLRAVLLADYAQFVRADVDGLEFRADLEKTSWVPAKQRGCVSGLLYRWRSCPKSCAAKERKRSRDARRRFSGRCKCRRSFRNLSRRPCTKRCRRRLEGKRHAQPDHPELYRLLNGKLTVILAGTASSLMESFPT